MAILSKDTTVGELEVLPNLVHSVKFVIGTSTSGHTLRDCDYLCDGVDDQVEINQALSSLPDTGGEIIVLNGTYNITDSITIAKSSTTLSGNGNNTVIKRVWNGAVVKGIIKLSSKNECTIQNLYLDGDKSSSTGTTYNIYLTSSSNNNTITGNTCNNSNYNIYLATSSNNNTITGNTCNNNSYGIYLATSSNNNTITGNTCNNNTNYGISLVSSSSNTVTGNTCNGNNSYGIYLNNSSNNIISGNTCNNNSNEGIDLYSSNDNTVTGNTCNNNDAGIYPTASNNNNITGNTCNNNGIYGIILYNSSKNNTVTGNTCNNNTNYGIRLSISCNNNTIVGNTCIRGTGLTSDYTSSQYSIYLNGTNNNYNLIAYNNIMGKNYTSGGGTGNTFTGNKYN